MKLPPGYTVTLDESVNEMVVSDGVNEYRTDGFAYRQTQYYHQELRLALAYLEQRRPNYLGADI